MSPGIVDREISRVERIDSVSPDNTVGIATLDVDAPAEAEGPFDLRRVRRALIAYEEECCGERDVYLGIKDRDDGKGQVLVLQSRAASLQTVVVAGRADDSGEGGESA